MADIKGWLRQPTTITGIGALIGVAATAVADYLTGSMTSSSAVGAVAFAATHLVMNDNTAAQDVRTLAADAVTAAVTRTLGASLPQLANDVARVVGDMKVAPAVAVVAPAPAEAAGAAPEQAAASPLGPAAALRGLGLLCVAGLAMMVSACSSPQGQKAVELACKIDQALVPIAAPELAQLAPTAVSLDQAVVHPSVVAYCAKLGGTAAAVDVPAAPPGAVAPAAGAAQAVAAPPAAKPAASAPLLEPSQATAPKP